MKRLLVALALIALVVGGVLWLARGPIVAGRLEAKLAALGYSCDGLDVEVEGDFSRVQVAPFTCSSDEGSIEQFGALQPIVVELGGLRVRRVFVPSAQIRLRRDDVSVDTSGVVVGGSRVHSAIARMLRLLDSFRGADLERLEISSLEVTYADEQSVRISAEGVELEPVGGEQGGNSVRGELASLRIAALGVAFTFDDVSCVVSQSEAAIEGALAGEAQLGPLELRRSWQFRARVSGLDEARPRLEFERGSGQ